MILPPYFPKDAGGLEVQVSRLKAVLRQEV